MQDTVKQELADKPVVQNDSWEIINSFFKENGLVSQQIESFNNFLGTSLQEIIQEVGQLKIFPSKQYRSSKQEDYDGKTYEINFKQIYVH